MAKERPVIYSQTFALMVVDNFMEKWGRATMFCPDIPFNTWESCRSLLIDYFRYDQKKWNLAKNTIKRYALSSGGVDDSGQLLLVDKLSDKAIVSPGNSHAFPDI